MSALTKAVREAAETDKLLEGVNQLDQQTANINSKLIDLKKEIEKLREKSPPNNETRPPIQVGAMGYSEATSWAQVVAGAQANIPVIVNRPLRVTGMDTLQTDAPLKFTPLGSLELDRASSARLRLPVINESNHKIFYGVAIREGYPDRWDTVRRTNLNGDFGGNPERDARWWGAKPHLNPNFATEEEAEANNHAIAAASLSQDIIVRQVNVRLGAGDYPVHRTVRLDGIRAHLTGAGGLMGATKLWANSNRFRFDTSHQINVHEFPQGTTPIIQVGWEQQPNIRNQDEGMNSGVNDLTIIGPITAQAVPISGIMWESGWQEGGRIRNVCVQNFYGYGIGGPRRKHIAHNTPDEKYYPPQVNSVKLEDIWIFGARGERAVGMSMFGVNYLVCGANTVDQQPFLDNGSKTYSLNHAILCGASGQGYWQNMHVETKGGAIKHAAICCPQTGSSMDRLTFDGVTNHVAGPHQGCRPRTLLLKNDRGGYNARSIKMALSHQAGGVAIEDEFTGKLSTGYDNSVHNGPWVASYSRQKTAGVAEVITSDPGLAL